MVSAGILRIAACLSLAVAGGLGGVLMPRPAQAEPSFDCAKASTAVERVICGDRGLSHLDDVLSIVYGVKRKSLSPAAAARLQDEQRRWLRERTTACGLPAKGDVAPDKADDAKACLIRRYEERAGQLTKNGKSPGSAGEAAEV